MLFNTGLFLVLFVLFIRVYHAVKHRPRLKMTVVIAFSLYFYYKSSAEYCPLYSSWYAQAIIFSGVFSGLCGFRCGVKAIVAINVLSNVGMLVWFKYFNLLADAFTSIIGRGFDPVSVILPGRHILLYFPFHILHCRCLSPHARAVPRPDGICLLPDIFSSLARRTRSKGKGHVAPDPCQFQPYAAMTSEGLFLVMTGLIKKVVIADYISGNFRRPYFRQSRSLQRIRKSDGLYRILQYNFTVTSRDIRTWL